MKPRVSVIVIAHDRRAYLLQALRSLEAQDLERDAFEVVIVKNFEDPIVDDFADLQGYKRISTELVSASDKLFLGYQACLGEIITFLEDDDLYVNSRIKSIIKIFDKSPEIDFYHNWHSVINSDGNIVRGGINGTGFRNGTDQLKIYGTSTSFQELHRIIRERAFFNISSIAVTRALLEKSFDNFGKELFGRDYYLFYAAAILGLKLGLDPRELTEYRLHYTNYSSAEYHGSEVSDFIDKRLKLYEKARNDKNKLLTIAKMVSPNVVATKVLEFEMICELLDNLYLSGRAHRRIVGNYLLRFIRACPRSDLQLLSLYSSLGVMSLVSPRLSSHLYLGLVFKLRAFR